MVVYKKCTNIQQGRQQYHDLFCGSRFAPIESKPVLQERAFSRDCKAHESDDCDNNNNNNGDEDANILENDKVHHAMREI